MRQLGALTLSLFFGLLMGWLYLKAWNACAGNGPMRPEQVHEHESFFISFVAFTAVLSSAVIVLVARLIHGSRQRRCRPS